MLTFEPMGYVNDDDAEEIDYGWLLTDMKEATRDQSAERVRAGYGPVELIGWAEQPHYEREDAHAVLGQGTELRQLARPHAEL